jgi:hypothetical protein
MILGILSQLNENEENLSCLLNENEENLSCLLNENESKFV